MAEQYQVLSDLMIAPDGLVLHNKSFVTTDPYKMGEVGSAFSSPVAGGKASEVGKN